MDDTLIGARAGYSMKDVEDGIRDSISRTTPEIPVYSEIKEFVPASFGIDSGHIDRYQDTYAPMVEEGVAEYRDEIRQLDILQEECAELIQALSKIKRLRDQEYNGDILGRDEEEFNDQWYEARMNLTEELAHVAISSAVVSRIYHISKDEIDTEVQRKDDLLNDPRVPGTEVGSTVTPFIPPDPVEDITRWQRYYRDSLHDDEENNNG